MLTLDQNTCIIDHQYHSIHGVMALGELLMCRIKADVGHEYKTDVFYATAVILITMINKKFMTKNEKETILKKVYSSCAIQHVSWS